MASLGRFLQDLIRAPRTVSSVVPFFAALARAMVAGLGRIPGLLPDLTPEPQG